MLPLILLGLAGTAAIAMMFDWIGPDDDPVTEETPDDPPDAPLSDLASVTDQDGQSLQPEEFWTEEEGFYAVTGTEGDDIITVDATTTDPDAAFDILVRPGEGDDQITVGIGTEVTMSEYDWLESTDAQDSDTGSDDVTVIVSEGRLDEIGQGWNGDGEQAGWVDLTDEKDSLDFEFDDDVTGNFHLITMDEQTGGDSSNFSSQYAWVVRTGEEVTDVQGNDWAEAFLGLNDTPPAPFQFVAGIDLGEYLTRMTNEDDANGDPIVERWDDQNSDPVITTNRAWTSVSTIVV